MPRNLIVKGHIAGFVNMTATDGSGEPICHILVDGVDGDELADSIIPARKVHDDASPGSWASTPAKYKRRRGEALHTFAGVPINPVVVE